MAPLETVTALIETISTPLETIATPMETLTALLETVLGAALMATSLKIASALNAIPLARPATSTGSPLLFDAFDQATVKAMLKTLERVIEARLRSALAGWGTDSRYLSP